ncbi:MAG TPA: insulinase family protein [Rhizomicrobium sp.]|jgi:zinc protease|nr:insulinase family protein [Rhizomicrobium sp.]
MTLLSRWLPAALTALVLTAAPALAAEPSAPWPQTGSDLPADVSVRFGTLPNGMRYAIKHNATPVGGVSLRLRIDAGSLMERDDEQGIAHMLEHMAFRGSAHVADGDTVRILQSLGLAFGADTNAFTASTQTVYSFDMPKNDTASVDTALMLMREIAGELNITKEALDTERNVVLAEAHTRDVPVSHLRKSDLAFLYGDRTAAAMTPIGLEDIVAHATPALVRGFYEAWYRPERATLIIVGDVDPAELEAKIKAKFSDWAARAAPRPVPVYAVPAQHATPVKLFAEPGAPPYMFFDFLRPYDPSPDNVANEARDVLRFIALGVVNQRFERLAHGTNPPFISASASHEHVDNVADATEIGVSYRDGQALDGAKAIERTWRDAVLHGVRQDEVDSVVAQLRTFFETNAAAADTTPSAQVVGSLLRSVDEKTVFTAPSSDLALYEAVVKGLTAAKVSEALKYVFGGDGPLVFTSASAPLSGGEPALKSALAQADGSPLVAGISSRLPPWPYDRFGKPGTVADTRTVDDLGITYVRFGNGVTLTIKPTQLHVGQILMNVRIGEGRLGLPRDHVAPAWALSGAFTQGGLRRYSIDDLQKRMSGKSWGITISVGDDAFSLNGQARASDIDAEMQVLAAYVVDPSWQPEAFDQMRIASAADYAQAQASPSSLLSRELYGLVHGGDTRWRAPTLAEIDAATVGEEKAILAPALASGPLDITIVGDVTVDQAIHSVAATFGALPPRPGRGSPVAGDEVFPPGTPQPVVLTHHGAPNQAIAAIVWPTAGFYRDMKLQRTLRVLMEVFGQRLLDVLRTREGITYTPGAASYSSLASPDYGFVYALAQIPPDKVAEFYKQVAVVADDLTANKITQEELDRFRGPRIQDIQKQQQTNEYWLQLLAGSAQDPRLLDVIRSTLPDLKSVTPEDVQKAAKDWLKDDKAYLLVVAPDGSTVPAPHS